MISDSSNPLVSVIMCVYNTPIAFLYESVKSILDQTYTNFEFIIVDDCSSVDLYGDNIFNNKHIIILKNQTNRGPSFSRNRALEIARGKYVAIMDSDDISLPTRLEKQVAFMEKNTDVIACGTWFRFIGIKNHEVKRVIDDNEYYKCCLIFGNSPTLLNPTVMIRNDVLKRNKIKYDETIRFGEDYKMWIQLSRLGTITNYKETLLLYRTHKEQSTYNNDIKRQSTRDDNKVKQEEILDKLKIYYDESEKDLFFNYLNAERYNANKYIKVLDKILESNKIMHIYQQDILEQRVHEQWVSVIQHVNNPFILLLLIFKQKWHRKEIITIKKKQLFR